MADEDNDTATTTEEAQAAAGQPQTGTTATDGSPLPSTAPRDPAEETDFETQPAATSTLKVMEAEDGDTRSALERAHDLERQLILGARDKPGETLLPGSETTITDHQRRLRETAEIERAVASDKLTRSSREQAIASDPTYSEAASVVVSESGSVGVLTQTRPGTEPVEGQEEGAAETQNGAAGRAPRAGR